MLVLWFHAVLKWFFRGSGKLLDVVGGLGVSGWFEVVVLLEF